jgi:hypothetical protein
MSGALNLDTANKRNFTSAAIYPDIRYFSPVETELELITGYIIPIQQ